MSLIRINTEVKSLRRIVNRLIVRNTTAPISEDNVSSPPTDAELDTAFGTAASLPNGFVGLVDDAAGDTTIWLCYVVSDSWYYEQLTKAT